MIRLYQNHSMFHLKSAFRGRAAQQMNEVWRIENEAIVRDVLRKWQKKANTFRDFFKSEKLLLLLLSPLVLGVFQLDFLRFCSIVWTPKFAETKKTKEGMLRTLLDLNSRLSSAICLPERSVCGDSSTQQSSQHGMALGKTKMQRSHFKWSFELKMSVSSAVVWSQAYIHWHTWKNHRYTYKYIN